MREGKDRPGSVLLGARTIQEGGAFLDVTREEVCVYIYVCGCEGYILHVLHLYIHSIYYTDTFIEYALYWL